MIVGPNRPTDKPFGMVNFIYTVCGLSTYYVDRFEIIGNPGNTRYGPMDPWDLTEMSEPAMCMANHDLG